MVRGEEILCTKCIFRLPYLSYGQDRKNPIVNRLVSVAEFRHGFALLQFQPYGIVQNLLHALKYQGKEEVGKRLGVLLGYRMFRQGYREQFDLVLPVPLHVSRERARGYNQSEAFATGLSLTLGKTLSNSAASRIKKTTTQTKKEKSDRWRNVRNAFMVKDPELISGKRILLVDDVITTGATMEAYAEELMKYGPLSLSAACIADVA